jgi:NAD(P)-dependent dehydrogenase (short-subunit alcohol dehydrogenase family)
MAKERWSIERIPDQTGRVVIVTGASSGLGLATTRALAHRGAHVILAVRNEEKGQQAARQIATERPSASLDVRRLDLADLDSVRNFADAARADYPTINVLINNAGIMAPPRTMSPQGHELQFAANYLGHFVLTGLLLDRLQTGQDPRVVTVTSINHRKASIYFDDLTGQRHYRPMAYYNQSKLADALFGWELDRRLRAAGSPVRSLLAHPGYSATSLQTTTPVGVVKIVFGRLLIPLAQASERGALPQLYAATELNAEGGQLIGPSGAGQLRGAPQLVPLAPTATDPEVAQRLWDVSEQLSDFTYRMPSRTNLSGDHLASD